jgi:glycosyltransferase
MTDRSTTNYPLLTDYSIVRYWKTQKNEFTTEEQRHRELRKGWMPPHPTLFIRKEVFEKYGLYNTELKIASDYEMILRLFYKHKITAYYLPLTTYLMSIGGASNRSLMNIIQKSKEDYRAMKMNGISFPIKTLISKNFRKLPQFLARDM